MDSPKHIKCMNEGKLGQTYRIAGRNEFKCNSCGTIMDAKSFDPIEFKWRDDVETWASWMKQKVKTQAIKIIDDAVFSVKNPQVPA